MIESVEIIGDIAEPVFSISDIPQVCHCRSSRESVGQDPLVKDPYEARTVHVGTFNFSILVLLTFLSLGEIKPGGRRWGRTLCKERHT
jgi:hypothetical protein